MNPRPRGPVVALLAAWLTIDLFGKSRRSGERGTGTLTTAVFTQGFLSYLFAALAFEDVAVVPFLAGTLSLVAGFSALALLGEVQDQAGHPADLDFVLATPIRRSTFLLARALHVTLFLGLFSFGLAIAPAVLAGFKTGNLLVVPAYLGLAFVLSATVAATIQLPIVVVTRLFGRDLGTSLSALTRAGLLGAGFLGVLLGFRAMYRGPDVFPGGMDLLQAFPSYWFAKTLAGSGTVWPWLTIGGPVAVAGLLALAGLLKERSRPARKRHREGLLARGPSLLLRRPRVRGLFVFTLTMLTRERSFRLRALPLLGLPAAAVILGLRRDPDPGAMPFYLALVHNLPLVYLPFLLFFVSNAEDWQAAWIVESAMGSPRNASRVAVAQAFAVLLVPLQVLLFALDVPLRPVGDAARSSLLALGVAWLALPFLARSLERTAFSQPAEDLAPPRLGPPLTIACVAAFLAVAGEGLPAGAHGLAAGLGLVLGVLTLRAPAADQPAPREMP